MTDNFIEEAAKALYGQRYLYHPWANLIEADKERWRKKARALLPIFAKHMTSDKALRLLVEQLDETPYNRPFSKLDAHAGIIAALKTLEG